MLADGGLTPGLGLSQDSWCDLGGWDLSPHSLASFRRPAWAYPPGGACRIPSSRKGISKHLVMSADAPKPSFRVQRNRLSVAEPHREGHMWSKGYRPCHAPTTLSRPLCCCGPECTHLLCHPGAHLLLAHVAPLPGRPLPQLHLGSSLYPSKLSSGDTSPGKPSLTTPQTPSTLVRTPCSSLSQHLSLCGVHPSLGSWESNDQEKHLRAPVVSPEE